MSTLFECIPVHSPHVLLMSHVISVPGLPLFAALNSASVYNTEHKQKNKNAGSLGMRLTTPIMIYALVHDQGIMIVYFVSNDPDQLQIFMRPNYHNHLLPYKVAVESAACL